MSRYPASWISIPRRSHDAAGRSSIAPDPVASPVDDATRQNQNPNSAQDDDPFMVSATSQPGRRPRQYRSFLQQPQRLQRHQPQRRCFGTGPSMRTMASAVERIPKKKRRSSSSQQHNKSDPWDFGFFTSDDEAKTIAKKPKMIDMGSSFNDDGLRAPEVLDIGSTDDEAEAKVEAKPKNTKAGVASNGDDDDDDVQRALDAVQDFAKDGSRVQELERVVVPDNRSGGGTTIAAERSTVDAAKPSHLVGGSTLSLRKAPPPKPRNGRGKPFGGKPMLAGKSRTGVSSNSSTAIAAATAKSGCGVADILAERRRKNRWKRFNDFDSDSDSATEWREAASKTSYLQQPKRTTPTQSKTKKDTSKEVIEIDSSGDKQDSPGPTVKSSSLTLFAIRISIGKKVVREDCKVSFDSTNSPTMTISHKMEFDLDEAVSYKIDLENDLLEEKHFLDTNGDSLTDGEMTNFLSLRITNTAENGLWKFPNAYDPESTELEKRYVVIEFRDEDQFADLLAATHVSAFESFMNGSKLTEDNKMDYCRVLEQDSEKQRRICVALQTGRNEQSASAKVAPANAPPKNGRGSIFGNAESRKKPSNSNPLHVADPPARAAQRQEPTVAAPAQTRASDQKQPVAKNVKTRLAALEKEIAGKVCSADLDLLTRLKRMEQIMLGKEVTGSVVQRLENLEQLVGMSVSLVR